MPLPGDLPGALFFFSYFYQAERIREMMGEEETYLRKEIFKMEKICFSWNEEDVSLVTDLYM